MTRDEILSKIKGAEAEARASVERAEEEKTQKIADATAEAANIVKNAEVESAEYYEKRLAEAASQIGSKKQEILNSGMKNVESMRGKSSANVNAAAEYLTKEFMGLSHA